SSQDGRSARRGRGVCPPGVLGIVPPPGPAREVRAVRRRPIGRGRIGRQDGVHGEIPHGPPGHPGLYSGLVTRDLADVLKDREHGFETDYFNKQDAKLIEKIRERAHLQEVAVALAEKLSVDEPALLERCVRLGLTRETGAALLLAPLVQMAWADGEVTPREREVLLGLAAARGVVAGTPPYDLVLAWLRERPAADVFDTALDVLRVGFAVLPPAERDERIDALLEACDRVAEASRGLGLLHFSRRASAEESAL